MIVLAFYLCYITLALLLSVKLFRLFRSRGRVAALFASIVSLCVLGLFFPIPIHGGFTFPLEMAWHELQREQRQQQVQKKDEKRLAFAHNMEQRFSGVLAVAEINRAAGGWAQGRIAQGDEVWLDEVSGLWWRAPQSVTSDQRLLTLEEAQAFCHQQLPQGEWALPTEAELALLWQHNGHRRMPGTGQSSAALLIDTSLQLEMATHYRGRVAGQAQRCVALSEQAPRRGYLADDLPLSLWNSYQLNKGEIYASTTERGVPPPPQEMK
jgi:hypothetical protein